MPDPVQALVAIALLLAVFAPAPLLAIVVLVVRLRNAVRRGGAGALPARILAAWRGGTRHPVWPGLLAVAAATAVLTVGLQRGYLAAAGNGPRWGFDVVLLSIGLALLAAIGCAAFASLVAVAVSRVRGFGAGTVAGVLTLVTIAVGTGAAHLPLRAAYQAEPDRFPRVANLADGDLLMPFQMFLIALLWTLPWPVLGAALRDRAGQSRRSDRSDRVGDAGGADRPRAVRDRWQLLLDLATTDLPTSRYGWGAALRAELAAIDPPAERRSFALGGAWAALRSATTRGTWALAAAVALVVAGGSFAASRWSLAHDRGGVLGFWIAAPSLLLLAIALVAAWRTRSFGSGLRAGAVAGVAALVAVLAVSVPEAVVWANQQAGYLSTGDAVPPNWQAAVRDVLRPEFLAMMIVFWAMGTAGGAALGTASGRLRAGTSEDRPPVTTR